MSEEEARMRHEDEIRNRLRPVCSHMKEEMFEELVKKIAENDRKALARTAIRFEPRDVTPDII